MFLDCSAHGARGATRGEGHTDVLLIPVFLSLQSIYQSGYVEGETKSVPGVLRRSGAGLGDTEQMHRPSVVLFISSGGRFLRQVHIDFIGRVGFLGHNVFNMEVRFARRRHSGSSPKLGGTGGSLD